VSKIPAFFITSVEKEEARKTGFSHVDKCDDFGDFKAQVFEAVKGDEANFIFNMNGIKFLQNEYISKEFIDREEYHAYSHRPGVKGCFASHFLLWNKCVQMDQIIGIFEYDAYQELKLPKKHDFENVLYLSAWRNFNGQSDDYCESRSKNGIHNYVGYDRWGYKNVMSGTHAYLIKPHAAKILIDTTKTKGWFPVDRFFSTDIVPISKQTVSPAVFKVENSLNLSYDYEQKGKE
jgi:GR25 family glycosyltransferase involved in LPS biosynthesis